MRTNTIKYAVLVALANGDTPMTCAEIWDAMDPEDRPAPSGGSAHANWKNLTSHMARVYDEHFVDRRKRDVQGKPMEYWLAAKGRNALDSNGDLPEDSTGNAPVAEGSPEAVDETIEAAETGGYVGADIEIATPEELNDVLVGICDSLMELRGTVEHLRADTVKEAEVDELRNDARKAQGAADRIRTKLNDLEDAVENGGGEDVDAGDFTRALRDIRALHDDGYGVYDYDYGYSYGGNVVEVRLKAKPAEKCDRRGPETSDEAAEDDR